MPILPVFLLVALAACGTDPNAARTTAASGTSATPTVAASSPSVALTTAKPTATGPAEGTVVVLPGDGITFTTAAQINATSWLTADANVFMVSELKRVQSSSGTCAFLGVSGYRVPDLVSGSEFDCPGGAQVLWGKTSSGWKLVFGGQYVPACSEIRAAGWTSTIPHDFIGGQCMEAGQTVDYKP
jgi:hypothetical protein